MYDTVDADNATVLATVRYSIAMQTPVNCAPNLKDVRYNKTGRDLYFNPASLSCVLCAQDRRFQTSTEDGWL